MKLLQSSLIIFIVLFYSCGEDNIDKQVEKLFYNNDKIKALSFIDEEGIRNGKSIQFYDNGEIEAILNYENGVTQGKGFWFYQNGELERICNYINDTLDGLYQTFYDSGQLEGVCNINKSINDGHQFIYYKNGNLKRYSYVIQDNQVYYRDIDESGILINEEGVIFTKADCEKADSNLYIKTINPPHTKILIEVEERYNNKVINSISINNYNKIAYKVINFNSEIIIYAEIKDNYSGEVFKDEVLLEPIDSLSDFYILYNKKRIPAN